MKKSCVLAVCAAVCLAQDSTNLTKRGGNGGKNGGKNAAAAAASASDSADTATAGAEEASGTVIIITGPTTITAGDDKVTVDSRANQGHSQGGMRHGDSWESWGTATHPSVWGGERDYWNSDWEGWVGRETAAHHEPAHGWDRVPGWDSSLHHAQADSVLEWARLGWDYDPHTGKFAPAAHPTPLHATDWSHGVHHAAPAAHHAPMLTRAANPVASHTAVATHTIVNPAAAEVLEGHYPAYASLISDLDYVAHAAPVVVESAPHVLAVRPMTSTRLSHSTPHWSSRTAHHSVAKPASQLFGHSTASMHAPMRARVHFP